MNLTRGSFATAVQAVGIRGVQAVGIRGAPHVARRHAAVPRALQLRVALEQRVVPEPICAPCAHGAVLPEPICAPCRRNTFLRLEAWPYSLVAGNSLYTPGRGQLLGS